MGLLAPAGLLLALLEGDAAALVGVRVPDLLADSWAGPPALDVGVPVRVRVGVTEAAPAAGDRVGVALGAAAPSQAPYSG